MNWVLGEFWILYFVLVTLEQENVISILHISEIRMALSMVAYV